MKIGQYCQRRSCRHVALEQFWQAFASRGFVSDSWAFLLLIVAMFQISWMLKRNEKNKMKWKNYCFYKLMLTNAEILFVCKLSFETEQDCAQIC